MMLEVPSASSASSSATKLMPESRSLPTPRVRPLPSRPAAPVSAVVGTTKDCTGDTSYTGGARKLGHADGVVQIGAADCPGDAELGSPVG